MTLSPVRLSLLRRSSLLCRLVLWLGLVASAEAEPWRVQLKWYHQFQFAGYYMAEKQGYFADEGLSVSILEGGPGRGPIATVLSGGAEFGVSDAEVLLARLRGDPIVVTAAVFQHSPYVIMSRADRGIRTPADLIGRTVMVSDDQGAAQLRAMLTREGIDPATVTFVPHSWNLDDLAAGRVDAISAYATVEPFMMRARGLEPSLLRTVDYGIDFYGDTLFTTAAVAGRAPEEVAALVRAVQRGWNYAFDYPEETIAHILTLPGVQARGITAAQLRSEVEAMRSLVLPEFVTIGHMNPDRWRHIAEVFASQGLAAGAQVPDDFFFVPDERGLLVRHGRLLAIGAGVVLLGLGAVLVWNLQMRRRVRQRTAELQAEIRRRGEIEEKLREQARLLDEAHDAIIVRRLDGTITYWNRGAEKLYGWTRAEAEGQRLDILLKADAKTYAEAGVVVLARAEWKGEIRKYTKDGKERMVDARWTLLDGGPNRPQAILAIDTDITEKKQLESQFLRAQRLESIGTLAGGIAHDLNNLLAPVVMGVDLLKDSATDPGSRMVIRNIERSARRGTDLVKQVLSFARGVEGARTLVNLRHLVRETEAMIQNTFPKQVRIESDVPRELWPVMCDPTQIDQVLLNLCVNARDAMPRGGLLSIRLRNVALDAQQAATARGGAAGNYVCIEVSDTGTGIPPEIVDRIFDPFFTTKEPGKGTGLGLSTVLGIVRSHGGFVRVESEVGRGSRFLVYLPASGCDSGPDATGGSGEALARGRGELILVVDDEASIVEITRQTLEAYGYRAIVADDGARAVGLFAQHRQEVKAVLTDVMMPVMDGVALIAALRRIEPGLPIIATSGQAGADLVGRMKEQKVAFLPKPFSAEAMLTLLKRILEESLVLPATKL